MKSVVDTLRLAEGPTRRIKRSGFGVRLLHGSQETTLFGPAGVCPLFALLSGVFVLRHKVL
jgi:hypothetical protein